MEGDGRALGCSIAVFQGGQESLTEEVTVTQRPGGVKGGLSGSGGRVLGWREGKLQIPWGREGEWLVQDSEEVGKAVAQPARGDLLRLGGGQVGRGVLTLHIFILRCSLNMPGEHGRGA